MMERPAKDCRIVLVRPRNPLNIGAAARAMANFGFTDLAVVEPYEEAWREARSAVGAEDVLMRARKYDVLADALADRDFVAGTTSGSRRPEMRGQLLLLAELPPRLVRRKTAILFGSEKHGLTNEHLGHCHAGVRIPTAGNCPSMNLGQSVAVCCYEIARAEVKAPRRKGAKPARMSDIEGLKDEWLQVLCVAQYCPTPPRTGDHTRLRQMLLRINPSARDVAILRGMLNNIAWKLGARK